MTKWAVKRVMFLAKKKAEDGKFKEVENGKDNIFRITKQVKKENQDIVGVKDDCGNLILSDNAKKQAWRERYERLLNIEFPWPIESLTKFNVDPVVPWVTNSCNIRDGC